MWLVLGQTGDLDADWLGGRLRAVGLTPLTVVGSDALVHGAQWEHRVGADGTYTKVCLADGTVIESTRVRAVLNRLFWLEASGFRGASARDREYATTELGALGQSWLHGLAGRIVNPPGANGLAGSWRTDSQWRWLGSRAGLRLAPPETPVTGGLSVLALDGETVGGDALPGEIHSGVRRLRELSGLDLLECRFRQALDGTYEFVTVPFLPELRPFGDAAVRAVHAALLARADAAGRAEEARVP
jgi:hypothetical protein